MDQAVKRRMAVARLVALLAPAILLGGALLSQYVGGLSPCEMCYWQRWPHAAAIAFALLAVLFRGGLGGRLLLILAALAIAVSGGIGIFHAGVEYGWWEGLTACSTSAAIGNAQDLLNEIGSAAGRDRVCQYVSIPLVAVELKIQKKER